MEREAMHENVIVKQRSRITWEGCSVLLDVNDGDRFVFARLTGGSKIKVGNKNCSLRPLIGCPFGSKFQVEVGADGPYLSLVTSTAEGNCNDGTLDQSLVEEQRDNRALVDNNTAQSLTVEDIDDMRRRGATGDQIVGALISNSATFGKKTAFSQEKYRIKKQKKYAPTILLKRPFARSICEAYFKKYAEKIGQEAYHSQLSAGVLLYLCDRNALSLPSIGYLRVDTLSLMLSMANISANSDVLLVDMLEGLVTGAVAERLGGFGYACNTYYGTTPYPSSIIRMFNFSDETCRRIVHCTLAELRSDDAVFASPNNLKDVCSNGTGQEEDIPRPSDVILRSSEDDINGDMDATSEATGSTKESKSVKSGGKAAPEVIKLWKKNGFSSLIVAAPNCDAWDIIKELIPLLSHSAPFVVYHQYLQPLATCMHNLQMEKMAIGLQISEPWLREYQVLPSRTHPFMQMSSSGGYLMSGTKISSSEAE